MLLSDRLRIPFVVLSLIGIAFGTLAIFVPLLIKEAGVNLNPGLFYTAAAIASFSVRIGAGRASDRIGRGRFITFSLILYALSLLLLCFARNAQTFLLAGFLEGGGIGTLMPMMIALTADRSLPQERGQVFSLTLSGFDLGTAIAGPILGFFAAQFGYRGLFGIASILALIACMIFVTLSSKNVRYSLRFSLGRGHDVYALPPSAQG